MEGMVNMNANDDPFAKILYFVSGIGLSASVILCGTYVLSQLNHESSIDWFSMLLFSFFLASGAIHVLMNSLVVFFSNNQMKGGN